MPPVVAIEGGIAGVRGMENRKLLKSAHLALVVQPEPYVVANSLLKLLQFLMDGGADCPTQYALNAFSLTKYPRQNK